MLGLTFFYFLPRQGIIRRKHLEQKVIRVLKTLVYGV